MGGTEQQRDEAPQGEATVRRTVKFEQVMGYGLPIALLIACLLVVAPFIPAVDGLMTLPAIEAGLKLHPQARLSMLPHLGAYVGADIVGGILATLKSVISSGRVLVATGIRKNTALANFEFQMVDSTDHFSPKTGLTVTAERSIDGAAYGACANSPSEVSDGTYVIDLDASDLNGELITFKFTATGADPTYIEIRTTP